MRTLLDSLRGARHIGLFVGLAALAILALVLLNAGESVSLPTQGSALEHRLEALLTSIDGVGPVSVMIAQDENGAVTGAVIVATELKGMRPMLQIQAAVKTLLCVELDRVTIIDGQSAYGGEAQ